jgi:hypothetical protein
MDDERENPVPLLGALPDEGSAVAWQHLSPEVERAYLQHLAGVDRLEDASSLQLVVNTATGGSIAYLGRTLLKLHELNLNGSTLESLRDLGTGFRLLQILWVSRCGLRDLDGLSGLPALRELYAAYNDVSDLQPLDACADLEVLDMEGNCVADAEGLHYLTACRRLQTLTLAGNPLAEQPGYRGAVHAALPGVHSLDDEPISAAPQPAAGLGAAHAAPPRSLLAPQHSSLEEPRPGAGPSSAATPTGSGAGGSGANGGGGGGGDAEEVALVVAGIKHARVGVDSHAFHEIEVRPLRGGCEGPGLPGSQWMGAGL